VANQEKALYLVVAPLALYLISAFILFRFSKGIASLLVQADETIEPGGVWENWQKPVYTLCLRVVGAVVVVRAVPSLVREILGIAFYPRPMNIRVFATWIPLVSAIVYLALGIYFIGGAKAIVRTALKGSLRESATDDE
jgi:hypothetical protein